MLRIAGIERESIVDGPGIRTVIFCQGCLKHCEGCHNPETWDLNGGRQISIDEVLSIIHSNPLCHGITYSGGEPFLQAEELTTLSERLKNDGYEIASYTGFTFDELLHGTKEQRNLLSVLDVLIDGPFILSERTLELNFRGSRISDILVNGPHPVAEINEACAKEGIGEKTVQRARKLIGAVQDYINGVPVWMFK